MVRINKLLIGTDNYLGGQWRLKRMATTLNNTGNVVILELLKIVHPPIHGHRDLQTIYKKIPDIKIIGDTYAGDQKVKVHINASEYLTKISNTHHIDGISLDANESSTDGVLEALRNIGIAGKGDQLALTMQTIYFKDWKIKMLIPSDDHSRIREMGYLNKGCKIGNH